jgi:hypothetical protein
MKEAFAVARSSKETAVMSPQRSAGPTVIPKTPSTRERRQVSPGGAALVLGTMLGGSHFLWAILVAAGWAQPVMDFVFRMHFLSPPWIVGSFHLGTAIVLIGLTAAAGCVLGYVLATLWNWIHG